MSRYLDAAADEAFLRRTIFSRFVTDENGCHLWSGHVGADGYGAGKFQKGTVLFHRLALVVATGLDDEALHAGHVCHDIALAEGLCAGGPCSHRRCINAQHLAWQTPAENVRASARVNVALCKAGHPMSGDNLIPWHLERGAKACRTCHRNRAEAQHALLREAARVLGLTYTRYVSEHGHSRGVAERFIAGAA